MVKQTCAKMQRKITEVTDEVVGIECKLARASSLKRVCTDIIQKNKV
jgi:hypothetical protein